MKLTNQKLKQLIKEELQAVINEKNMDEGIMDYAKAGMEKVGKFFKGKERTASAEMHDFLADKMKYSKNKRLLVDLDHYGVKNSQGQIITGVDVLDELVKDAVTYMKEMHPESNDNVFYASEIEEMISDGIHHGDIKGSGKVAQMAISAYSGVSGEKRIQNMVKRLNPSGGPAVQMQENQLEEGVEKSTFYYDEAKRRFPGLSEEQYEEIAALMQNQGQGKKNK